jgi:hypothetical protein
MAMLAISCDGALVSGRAAGDGDAQAAAPADGGLTVDPVADLVALPADGDAGADAARGSRVDLAPRVEGGTVPPTKSPVKSCTGATVSASPGSIASVLGQYRGKSVVINASPGTYSQFGLSTFPCVELRCTVPAIVNGAPNKKGCVVTRAINITHAANVIIEGFTFINDNKSAGGAADYGIAVYAGTTAIRIANNAFNGNMNHDISTKNEVGYAEILDNLFVSCMRHCFEIGQNGNIPSRPSTCGTAVVKGNTFSSRINGLTQRYNQTLIVEGNKFGSVAGWAVQSWPFWDLYQGEYNQVPKPPLRTSVIGNSFSPGNRMSFQGRGVKDDVVLVKGNTGSVPACQRISMDSTQATYHSNEETTAPPKLDPASDIACAAK